MFGQIISCDYSLDSRLRWNDRHLHPIVIPAKAGIQELLPELIEKLPNNCLTFLNTSILKFIIGYETSKVDKLVKNQNFTVNRYFVIKRCMYFEFRSFFETEPYSLSISLKRFSIVCPSSLLIS